MAEETKKVVRAARRRLQGRVVSDKMDKTIVVLTENHKTHPIYKKRVMVTKKYKVDDPKEEAKIGDTVIFEECRPLSHNKRFRLIQIVKKGE